MMDTPSIRSARNPDLVDVTMPSTMNEYFRLMSEAFVETDETGRYVLRHGEDFWKNVFENAFDEDGPSPDMAFEHLVSVLSDWNDSMSDAGMPTPVP